MTVPRHFKTAEIAELLAIAPATLRKAALRGEISPVRVGGDLIWPEPEIERWLAANRVDNGNVVSLARASSNRRGQ